LTPRFLLTLSERRVKVHALADDRQALSAINANHRDGLRHKGYDFRDEYPPGPLQSLDCARSAPWLHASVSLVRR
jgi:hypothetical protein